MVGTQYRRELGALLAAGSPQGAAADDSPHVYTFNLRGAAWISSLQADLEVRF